MPKKPQKKVQKVKSVKKVVVAKKMIAKPISDKALTKTGLCSAIAEHVGQPKKVIGEVIEALQSVAFRHLKKGGVGYFTLPGLAKLRLVKKPAVPARQGINPFTGESTVFKAKPPRNIVKFRALKKLKEMVE